MQQFSTWLAHTRTARSLSIIQLSALTGLDTATIRRAEQGSSSTTLLTAWIVTQALHIPIEQFLQDFQHISLPRPQFQPERMILTGQDLQNALSAFRHNRGASITWFSGIMNRIMRSWGERQEVGVFTPGVIHLMIGENPLYRAQLHYPPKTRWTPAHVLNLYARHGVLCFQDVKTYAALVGRMNGRELHSNDLTRITTPLAGNPERMRLSQIVRLDKALEQNGLLLALCFRAMQVHVEFFMSYAELTPELEAQADQEKRWLLAFLIACRWLELIGSQREPWLPPVRARLQQLNESSKKMVNMRGA